MKLLDRAMLRPVRDASIGLARRFGLDVRRNGPSARADLRLAHFLRERRVDLVLDVGANRGQFGDELFAAGYEGRLVSFEALPTAHADLRAHAAASRHDWLVEEPIALSDAAGTAIFHVTEADTSSSLLVPTTDFVESAPFVAVRERLTVRTERLDVLAEPHLAGASRPFLKVDVQGAELAVLHGSSAILPLLDGLIVEACIDNLYAGQSNLGGLIALIEDLRFALWDISCGYRDARTYRAGCIDIIAFRGD